jgi:putative transposase
MSKSRHTEAQIIAALKQVEAGARRGCGAGTGRQQAHDLCLEGEVRRHGSERGRRGQALRDENSRLKKLVADLSLDKDMLQSVIRKNSLGS